MPFEPLPTTPTGLKWAKWAVGLSLLDLAGFDGLIPYAHETGEDNGPEWRRLHVIGTRDTPVGTLEDVSIMTFDLLNITAGLPDFTWTTGDYTTAESKFDTMFNAWVSGLSPKLQISQYRWYKRHFNAPGTVYPTGKPNYFAQSGPPVRITAKAISGAGTGTQQMPYQVAISVTEKTAVPKHWGRFYIPNPGVTMFDAFGRIAGTTFIHTPAVTCYAALADAELFPVVPSGRLHQLLGVTQLQVDDVPDVQRSRRAKHTLVRTVGP